MNYDDINYTELRKKIKLLLLEEGIDVEDVSFDDRLVVKPSTKLKRGTGKINGTLTLSFNREFSLSVKGTLPIPKEAEYEFRIRGISEE